MLEHQVINLNTQIIKNKLVTQTWGNGSMIDRNTGYVYIKPSGVNVTQLYSSTVSVVDLSTGKHIRGSKPSVDTPTHLEIYNGFEDVQSIIHTHSMYCTVYAQAKKPIKCLGTTHSDYFNGDVPVINGLTKRQVAKDYEKNTGESIVKYFKKNNIDHRQIPACLLPSHGVFVWGNQSREVLTSAIVLEHIAKLAYMTEQLNPEIGSIDTHLIDKHFLRKHGDTKYYGQ